jgi:hypothetical protein
MEHVARFLEEVSIFETFFFEVDVQIASQFEHVLWPPSAGFGPRHVGGLAALAFFYK